MKQSDDDYFNQIAKEHPLDTASFDEELAPVIAPPASAPNKQDMDFFQTIADKEKPYLPNANAPMDNFGNGLGGKILNNIGAADERLAGGVERYAAEFPQRLGGYAPSIGGNQTPMSQLSDMQQFEKLQADQDQRAAYDEYIAQKTGQKPRSLWSIISASMGANEQNLATKNANEGKAAGDLLDVATSAPIAALGAITSGGHPIDQGLALQKAANATAAANQYNVPQGGGTYYAAKALEGIGAIAPALGVSAITKNPEFLAGALGLQGLGDEYATQREAGKTPSEAQAAAVPVGGLNYAIGALPLGQAIESSSGIIKTVGKTVAEQAVINNLLSDAQLGIEQGTLHPDQTFGDYLKKVADTTKDNTVLGVINGVLFGGVGHLAGRGTKGSESTAVPPAEGGLGDDKSNILPEHRFNKQTGRVEEVVPGDDSQPAATAGDIPIDAQARIEPTFAPQLSPNVDIDTAKTTLDAVKSGNIESIHPDTMSDLQKTGEIAVDNNGQPTLSELGNKLLDEIDNIGKNNAQPLTQEQPKAAAIGAENRAIADQNASATESKASPVLEAATPAEEQAIADYQNAKQQEIPFSVTPKTELSDRFIATKDNIKAQLTNIIKRINPDVKTEFADRLFGEGEAIKASGGKTAARQEVAGSFDRMKNLIAASLNTEKWNPLDTSYHEAYHSIRDMVTPADDAVLKKAFPGTDKLSQPEHEAVEFGRFMTEKNATGFAPAVRRVFSSIRQALRDIGRTLKLGKFNSVEDIFNRAERGSVYGDYQKALKSGDVESLKRLISADGMQYKADGNKFTAAFKKWFGDSKVVDDKGEPLRVFHGTDKSFESFDISKATAGRYGTGIYFSEKPRTANVFSAGRENGNTVPAYLSVKNPLILEDHIGDNAEEKLRDMYPSASTGDEITRAVISSGYDGIVVKSRRGDIREAIVFKPTQIKSAIGNNGNYDPKDPRIAYKASEENLTPEQQEQAIKEVSPALHDIVYSATPKDDLEALKDVSIQAHGTPEEKAQSLGNQIYDGASHAIDGGIEKMLNTAADVLAKNPFLGEHSRERLREDINLVIQKTKYVPSQSSLGKMVESWARTLKWSAENHMRWMGDSHGVPEANVVADHLYNEPGKTTGLKDMPFGQMREYLANNWKNTLARSIKEEKLTPKDLNKVAELMQFPERTEGMDTKKGVAKVALQAAKIVQDIRDAFAKAGRELPEVNNFFPRIEDISAIMGDIKGFKEQRDKVNLLTYGEDWRKEHDGLQSNLDRLKAKEEIYQAKVAKNPQYAAKRTEAGTLYGQLSKGRQTRISNIEKNYDPDVEQYIKNKLRAKTNTDFEHLKSRDLGIRLDNGKFSPVPVTGDIPSSLKQRVLVKEREDLERKYLIQNPYTAIFRLADQAATNLAWEHHFGNGKWEAMEKKMVDQGADGDFLTEIRKDVAAVTGIAGQMTPRTTKTLASLARYILAVGTLPKAVFVHGMMPFLTGIQAGNPLRSLGMIHGMMRETFNGNGDKARAVKDYAEMLGFESEDAERAQLMNNTGMHSWREQKFAFWMYRFFRGNGISSFMRNFNANQYGFSGLKVQKLAEDIVDHNDNYGGKYKSSQYFMEELGIAKEDVRPFAEWVTKTVKDGGNKASNAALANRNDPMAQMFHRVVVADAKMTSLAHDSAVMPRWANAAEHPFLSIAYAISHYKNNFAKNVLMRSASLADEGLYGLGGAAGQAIRGIGNFAKLDLEAGKQSFSNAKEAVTGNLDKGYSALDRTRFLMPAMQLPLLYLYSMGYKALYNVWTDSKEKTPLELQALQRSDVAGDFQPIINAVFGQSFDAKRSILGPGFERTMQYYDFIFRPTNNHERQMQRAWSLVVAPTLTAATTTLSPVGPLGTTIATTLINSPEAKDAFVDLTK